LKDKRAFHNGSDSLTESSAWEGRSSESYPSGVIGQEIFYKVMQALHNLLC
jgi:hypothetical protein